MHHYSRQIADFVANLSLADVPANVVAQAKNIILDGLACGLYGSDLEWTRILAGVVNRLDPNGGTASVWGGQQTASPVNAALVNGTMIQGFELDDGGTIHASAAVLPAAIAAAEYVGLDKVDGATLLRAIIAGYEIGPRVGICMRAERMISIGWHAPAVNSSFPAAMTAGVILGLSTEQLFHALGIAGTQACGLMAAQYGSMVKRMQCAKNSQSGLYAALLAADGFTGIENIFEEKYGGFCTTFTHSEDKFDLPALTKGLGSEWETMRIGIKIYACMGGIHATVSAIEELMDKTGVRGADVEEVTVGVTEAQVKHCGWFPYVPKGLTAAQMHMGFCVATQLIEGGVFVDQMVEANAARPDLVELANRVKVVRSLERESRGERYRRGADVKITLKNGTMLNNSVDYRPGSEHKPLTESQVTAKFLRLASKVLTSDKSAHLKNFIGDIEKARSVGPLVKLLCNRSFN